VGELLVKENKAAEAKAKIKRKAKAKNFITVPPKNEKRP
jgi:hypothetical protein